MFLLYHINKAYACHSLKFFPFSHKKFFARKKTLRNYYITSFLFECGDNLSSRTVASQVLSARLSLTSVFGMRTGGSSTLSSPQWLYKPLMSRYIYFFRNPLSTNSPLSDRFCPRLGYSRLSTFFINRLPELLPGRFFPVRSPRQSKTDNRIER